MNDGALSGTVASARAIVASAASLSRWCILRTASPRTMPLARSLAEAGFEAWTPTDHITRRVPRGDRVERFLVPLMPSYVFVREHHLPALREIERADVRLHPAFSVWKYAGDTLYVRHAALHPLRAEQQRRYLASLPKQPHARTKDHGEPYAPGDRFAYPDGPFAGLMCEVEESNGRITTVSVTLFGRRTPLKRETSQLRANGVAPSASAA